MNGHWVAMYLLVFFTLMISIIGLYTQVIGLQTARFAANQSGIGSAMLQWQAAAVSMAVSILKTNNAAYQLIATTGCSLTFTLPPGVGGTFKQCPSPSFVAGQAGFGAGPGPVPVNVAAVGNGTITDGSTPPKLNRINYYHPATVTPPAAAYYSDECVHLSATCTSLDTGTGNNGCLAGKCTTSYDVADYQFYSVLYQDSLSNQNFVITFLPAPIPSATNPAGYLLSTSGTNLNIGVSDLLRQIGNTGWPIYSYGTFNGFPTPQLMTTGFLYTLPTALKTLCAASTTCTANGSVAVINSPDGL